MTNDNRAASEPKPDLANDEPADDEPEDEVDEAGEESFPASDPPPWTPSVAD